MNQGQESNLSGTFLEQTVERAFNQRGVRSVLWREKYRNDDLFEDRLLLKQVPFSSLYIGHEARIDFVFRLGPLFKLAIECKAQNDSGSVDEKFPYVLLSAQKAMPWENIWILLFGGGFRSGGRSWLEENAKAIPGKIIRVMDLNQFQRALKPLVESGIA